MTLFTPKNVLTFAHMHVLLRKNQQFDYLQISQITFPLIKCYFYNNEISVV